VTILSPCDIATHIVIMRRSLSKTGKAYREETALVLVKNMALSLKTLDATFSDIYVAPNLSRTLFPGAFYADGLG
jgi:hypothetical protein